MALITKDSLQSFLGANNFLVKDTDAPGFDEGIALAEGVVLGKIGISESAIAESATQLVSFCAHACFIYLTSFRQTLKADEKDRVKNLYDEAQRLLNEIAEGKIKVVAESTDSTDNTIYVNSANRSERF
jgi:phage gp36-like protein